MNKCPICDRIMIDGPSIDEHHLVPKTFKGKEKVLMHRVCHRTIHATFTEREIANHYNTIDSILGDERIQRFVKWVAKKDPEFYDVTKETRERRGRRKR